MYVCCFLIPIVTYIYCKQIFRGIIAHFIGIGGGLLGLTILLSSFKVVGSNIELMISIGSLILFSTYAILCIDAIKTTKKYFTKKLPN